jgi:hypothetical protein
MSARLGLAVLTFAVVTGCATTEQVTVRSRSPTRWPRGTRWWTSPVAG